MKTLREVCLIYEKGKKKQFIMEKKEIRELHLTQCVMIRCTEKELRKQLKRAAPETMPSSCFSNNELHCPGIEVSLQLF